MQDHVENEVVETPNETFLTLYTDGEHEFEFYCVAELEHDKGKLSRSLDHWVNIAQEVSHIRQSDPAQAERLASTALEHIVKVRSIYRKKLGITDEKRKLFPSDVEYTLLLYRAKLRQLRQDYQGALEDSSEGIEVSKVTLRSKPSYLRAAAFTGRAITFQEKFAASKDVDYLERAIADLKTAWSILKAPGCRQAAHHGRDRDKVRLFYCRMCGDEEGSCQGTSAAPFNHGEEGPARRVRSPSVPRYP